MSRALSFVPHLFRSDIIVAVQPDETPIGAILARAGLFAAYVTDDDDRDNWLDDLPTLDAAKHRLVQYFRWRFGP